MRTYILIIIAVAAAIMDITKLKISNRIIAFGLIMGLFISYLISGVEGLRISTLGAIVPIVSLWSLYRLKILGAGDVKLFSVIGTFIGPISVVYCIAISIMIGGLMGLIILIVKHKEKGLHQIRFAIPVLVSVLIYGGGYY